MASVQSQVRVRGTFTNETSANLELIEIKTYSGFFEDKGPAAILENGDKTSFRHRGTPPGGSMVMVAYRGPNGDQWVLGWIVPEPSTPPAPNRVLAKHVEAGVSIDYENIGKELDEVTIESNVDPRYFKVYITPKGTNAELTVSFLNLPKN